MSVLKVFRNDLPVFETHLNEGEGAYQVESNGDVEVWIGPASPAPQQIAEAANLQVTEPTLVMDYIDLTVEELKGLLRDKDLPVSGTKDELISRLDRAFVEDATA